MKEVLFRGKRTDNSEWVKGNHLYDDVSGKHYIVPFGNITESTKVGQDGCCYCVGFEVIPETVGQYIGSKDKHDKEIFGGDTIRYDNQLFEIKYIEGFACFACRNNNARHCPSITSITTNYFEVIGNIYDDPEMLEVAEGRRARRRYGEKAVWII